MTKPNPGDAIPSLGETFSPPEGFPGKIEGANPDGPTYSARVTFEATYVITPKAGGKRLQGTILLRDNGQAWIRSYRPVPEEYRFADRRVVVTGRPYRNSPYVQSVGGTHFEIETIDFAPGETPVQTNPSLLPAPPFIRGLGKVASRGQQWGQCRGQLLRIDPLGEDPNPANQRTALFRFEDGSEIPLYGIPSKEEEWTSLQGQSVTILTYFSPDKNGTIRAVANGICKGEDERCGMDDYPAPR
ncbi:MAG: hypothetical protein VX498_14990 [Myxococcota bacterium]|nr:hypothetical protein [Myxococcota bacterium]